MHPAVEDVGNWIEQHHLLPAGCGCVIATSGGCDSIFLLHALASLHPARNTCVVAHFHHRLRGADADADLALVRAAAASLGIPFAHDRADVRVERHPGESIETAARRLRHAFLARTARVHGLSRIATGHSASDQDELFLLRLMRGAGPGGLAGMAPAGPSPADAGLLIVRPLLALCRRQIRSAAAKLGLAWREDPSNQDPAHLRNRVRHELLPLLESLQPGWRRVSRRTQALLSDQEHLVRQRALEWLKGSETQRFHELPAALQREVVRAQLDALQVGTSFDLVECLRQRLGSPVQAAPGLRLTLDPSGTLRTVEAPQAPGPFLGEEQIVPLDAGSGETTFAHLQIHWERVASLPTALASGRDTGAETLDAEALGPWVRLRHWRPGDRFRPIGLQGSAKLQDLFTNAGIPPAERRRRVLAETADGEIFWVEGLRIGERVRVGPATRRGLRWRSRPA